MENRFQATFMPRQPAVAGAGDTYVRPKGPPNFLKLIGVIIFILALAAVGGLYLLKGIITASNNDKKLVVEEAIRNFEPELTRELSIIKARMDAGKQLIDNHKAASLFFSILELNTVQSVRFTEFTYSVGADKRIGLSMKGEARSYNSIAYQSDVFSRVEHFKSPVFSGMTVDERGTISFNVTADLNPESLAYKNLVREIVPGTFSATPNTATTTLPTTGTTTPIVPTPGTTSGSSSPTSS